ncbi:hypothetical protein BDV41DRAFT_523660, partial [Aspergillus transmontanensis]
MWSDRPHGSTSAAALTIIIPTLGATVEIWIRVRLLILWRRLRRSELGYWVSHGQGCLWFGCMYETTF